MKISILDGDGFCAWPTCLHRSNKGYKDAIVDNLSWREININLECETLTPICLLTERICVWKNLFSKNIDFFNFNILKDYQHLLKLIKIWRPEVIAHSAELRLEFLTATWKWYTKKNNLMFFAQTSDT